MNLQETLHKKGQKFTTMWYFCERRGHNKMEMYSTSKEGTNKRGNRTSKNFNTSWKLLIRKGLCIIMKTRGKGCLWGFFFKEGKFSRDCSYLYIHSFLFQSPMNSLKSLVKDSVNLVLSFYLPLPYTSVLHSFPTPVCTNHGRSWTEPQSSLKRRFKPACRYCSSFCFFNNVSCI